MSRWNWVPRWLLSFSVAGWVVIIGGVFFLQFVSGRLLVSAKQISSDFSAAAGRSAWSIGAEMLGGFFAQPQTEYRWLILGTDEVVGSNRPTILTDIVVVASFRPADNTIRLLSLPRDWYLPEYGTKVNGLYRLSLESGLPAGHLPEIALEENLGLEIDNVIVVRMADVSELIDILGGVEVEVPHAFSDPLYPRDGVDVTIERDPMVLYETLSFEAGWQRMDGPTAVKYIRTRHSADPSEGSDQARIRRQQQVLNAVVAKISSEQILSNPTTLGEVYSWYSQTFARSLPLGVVGEIGRVVVQKNAVPSVESLSIPATDLPRAPTPDTLFVHPPLNKYGGQWVYDLADTDGSDLREFVINAGL